MLNVRPLPANGLARIWQKPMIEVLAYAPESAAVATPPISDDLAEFRQLLQEIKELVERRTSKDDHETLISEPDNLTSISSDVAELDGGQWRVGAVLNKAGLLPVHVQRVLDQLHTQYGSGASGENGGGNRACARGPCELVAQTECDCAEFDACSNRAGGFRQDDLPVQMADAGGISGWAHGAGVAIGWGHGEHGGIVERLLRDFGCARGTLLAAGRGNDAGGHWFYRLAGGGLEETGRGEGSGGANRTSGIAACPPGFERRV